MHDIELYDKEGRKINLDDKVELYGFEGTVVCMHGAYGIGMDQVPWYTLEKQIESETGYKNTPCFCQNDNFVSFWELAWNYDCMENHYNMVRVVKESTGEDK